jgi:AraC-like DNA-binding protein
MLRKKEGFKGQKSIVLPDYLINELISNTITRMLYVTDIGYYPAAMYHYRQRDEGCRQNILIYCIKGKGWINIQNKHYDIKQDNFFIIPASIPHKYGADNNDPWFIYWLHFTGDLSYRYIKSEFKIESLDQSNNARINDRINLFEEIYQTLATGYSNENLEYASLCLGYLLASFCYYSNFERFNLIYRNDIIEKSIKYMHTHIEDKITLSELASVVGCSVSHFSMLFKKRTSCSPIEYYNNLKIQKACQMLKFSNMHIKEIANILHYDDQYYFSRIFRKIMGISPLYYRKMK